MIYPRHRFRRITHISPAWLKRRGIGVLLLDVDNTLTTHGCPDISREVVAWLEQMRENKIALLILSNNSAARVKPLADRLGIGYIARAAKPLGFSVRRAMKELGINGGKAAIVGDQIFTDVLCANLAGLTSILLEPIELESHWGFRFKRKIERIVLKKARDFEQEETK